MGNSARFAKDLAVVVASVCDCTGTELSHGGYERRAEGRAEQAARLLKSSVIQKRDDEEHPMGIPDFGHGSTKHHRLEGTLRDSHSLFQGLIDTIADAIFVRDRGGQWLHVNEAFCRLTGCRRNELLDRSGFEGFSEDLASLLGEGDTSIFETDLELTKESEVATVGGERCHLLIRKKLLRMQSGEPLLVGTLSDITEQRRMDVRLRRREQGFRSLAENSPDVIVRYDRECRRLYANPAWERVNGISRQEVIGKTPTEIAVRVKAIAHEYETWLHRVVETGQAAGRDLTWLNETDEPVCFAQTAMPEFDSDGNVTSVLTVARDVSALRNVERWMIRFVAHVPGYLFTFKIDPRNGTASMPFVSPGIRDVAGIDLERAPTDVAQLLDVIHPEDRGRLLETPVDSAGELETRTFCFRIAHPTRGVRWLESYASPERTDDGCILLHGMTLDVTERKRMQLEVEKREREFRSLAENSPDNIVRYDRQCRAIFANHQHPGALCTSVSTYLRKASLEMLPDGFCEGGQVEKTIYQATLEQVISTGEVREVEMTIPGPSGNMLTHLVRLAPERDANGDTVGALAFGRDITERKQHEQMLQKHADLEMRLSHCIASTPGFFFTLVRRRDGHCYLPFASPGILDLFGVRPSDVADGIAPLIARSHPDDVVRISHVIANSAREMLHFEVEFRVKHPERGELWVEARAVPHREKDGSLEWHGFMHDDTHRKSIESALQARESEFRALVENAADPICRYDRDGRRIYANTVSLSLLERIQEQSQAVLHEKSTARCVREVVESGQPTEAEFELPSIDGSLLICQARFVPEFASDGTLSGVLSIGRDVTGFRNAVDDLARTLKSLGQREQEFRTLTENSPDTIARYDRECRRVFANSAYATLAGLPAERLLGKTPREEDDSRAATEFERHLRETMERGRPMEAEYAWSTQNGRTITSHVHLAPEFDERGCVISVLAVGRDVTALKESQRRLEEAQGVARVGHWEWDFGRERAFLSSEACRILGKPKGWAPTIWQLFQVARKKDRAMIMRHLQKAISERQSEISYECEIVVDHETVHIASHGRIEYGDAPVRIIVTTQDVTREKEYERRLHDLAFLDPLTGLANRALFNDRLRQAITRAAREKTGVGVMVIDLDRFKIVNDSLGHSAGDILLQEVGMRLHSCLRETDTVARMGGDEFAIILPDLRSDIGVGSVADKLLAELERPVIIDGRDVFVTSSIGIATYPRDSGDVAELLSFADMAMYHAKGQGKNTFQFYSEELRERSKRRLTTEMLLRGALLRDELELHFQPQVDLLTRNVVGAEALLRWNNPQLGIVRPADFIGIAEDTGLILDIGEWVFRKACQAAVEWNRPGRGSIKVAINLSPRQFRAGDHLMCGIRRVIDETGCSPRHIELEITESLIFDDFERARAVLCELHRMGFAIALDDFGTGHSILGYLKRFPVDQLKIDRSFLQGVPICPDGSDLVMAIISMARTLRLGLIAEGVETVEQAEFLAASGCSVAQGFLFGKPMERHEFEMAFGLRGNGDG